MIHSRKRLTSGLINQFSSTVGILGERLTFSLHSLTRPTLSPQPRTPLELFPACSLPRSSHESHVNFFLFFFLNGDFLGKNVLKNNGKHGGTEVRAVRARRERAQEKRSEQKA